MAVHVGGRGPGHTARVRASSAIGGVAIGAAGSGIYSGFNLLDGDEFDAFPDLARSTNPAGSYFSTRIYQASGGLARGSTNLGGEDVDPYYVGDADYNRGAAIASFSDSIVAGTSSVVLKSRQATAGEILAFSNPGAGRLAISSMLHTAGFIQARPPCMIEARVKFGGIQGAGSHRTVWLMQGVPSTGNVGYEFDLEEDITTLKANVNLWGGVTAGSGSSGVTALASFDSSYHTLTFALDATSVRFYADGTLKNTYTLDATTIGRPWYLLLTNHIVAADYVDATWAAAGSAGSTMEVDYIRVWGTAAGRRTPLVSQASINVDFNTAFSTALDSAATIWGDGSVTEWLEAIPNERVAPGGAISANTAWRNTGLPSGLSYSAGTLSGTVSDQPGRFYFSRLGLKAGESCRPQRFALNVGPRMQASQQTITVDQAFSFDLYALCDCGDLVPKTVSVSNLPTGLSYNSTTGLITGTPTVLGTTTVSVTVTNSAGQSKSGTFDIVVQAASPPITSFSDNFNRANENLEASSNWTRLDGTAGALAVASNQLRSTTTDTTGTAYVCPDLGSNDHYVEGKIISASSGPFLACRVTNSQNYIGLRRNGSTLEVYKRISGTLTQIASFTPTIVSGDIFRLEVQGTNIAVKQNGSALTPATGSLAIGTAPAASTRQGIVARSAAINPWTDDFAAGVL